MDPVSYSSGFDRNVSIQTHILSVLMSPLELIGPGRQKSVLLAPTQCKAQLHVDTAFAGDFHVLERLVCGVVLKVVVTGIDKAFLASRAMRSFGPRILLSSVLAHKPGLCCRIFDYTVVRDGIDQTDGRAPTSQKTLVLSHIEHGSFCNFDRRSQYL